MLAAAVAGRPVIPVFILDPETEAHGAAPKWRLGLGGGGVRGSGWRASGRGWCCGGGRRWRCCARWWRRRGRAAVWWSRLYDPASVARDTGVKAALKARGVEARSFAGHLLHEPWTVETGQGGFYRVFTPYLARGAGREVAAPLPAAARLHGAGAAGLRATGWRTGVWARR